MSEQSQQEDPGAMMTGSGDGPWGEGPSSPPREEGEPPHGTACTNSAL